MMVLLILEERTEFLQRNKKTVQTVRQEIWVLSCVQ